MSQSFPGFSCFLLACAGFHPRQLQFESVFHFSASRFNLYAHAQDVWTAFDTFSAWSTPTPRNASLTGSFPQSTAFADIVDDGVGKRRRRPPTPRQPEGPTGTHRDKRRENWHGFEIWQHRSGRTENRPPQQLKRGAGRHPHLQHKGPDGKWVAPRPSFTGVLSKDKGGGWRGMLYRPLGS